MIPGISAIAFDLDGTLYPNYSLYIRLLPFLFRHAPLIAALGKARRIMRHEQELSPSSLPPDFYERQAQITADILQAKPEKIREKIERLIYRGWEAHFVQIPLFSHVRELLDALRAARFKLGLLSDFPPHTKLENLKIAGYWDTILCSECTGAIKPALKPFTALANALDCRPDQILYVGNSHPYDVIGAARAGMKTALLAGRLSPARLHKKNVRADFIFHDYRQLRDFVLQ